MKKKVLLVLVAIMAVWQNAFAYDFAEWVYMGMSDGAGLYRILYFNITGNTVTVTYKNLNYTAAPGILNIPSSVTHDGTTYIVTGIDNYAFKNCTGLTSLTIPNTVTNIGSQAFYGCTGLPSVTIPNSVTSIGSSAFFGCSGIDSLTVGSGLTNIGSDAFQGDTIKYLNYNCPANVPASVIKDSLVTIVIGDSITTIGSNTFSGCTSLTHVVFNAVSCMTGGSSSNPVFNGCSNIQTFTFGNNVQIIPSCLCVNCTELTSVTIPNSVTNIGNWAFKNCTGLTSVQFNAVSCGSAGSYDSPVFSGCSNITDFYFGNSVTEIPSYLCKSLTGLTSITLPNSVTSIDEGAFWGCTGLTSVTIPNSVTSIGDRAFSQCTGLMSVTIPNSVTSINESAFRGCTGLTSVTIPNSVTSIGECAFQGCTGLTSVTIPSSVTSIGDEAFKDCTGLTSVHFNAVSCGSVGSYQYPTFNGCSNITNIYFGNSVTTIPSNLCRNLSSLTSVMIGNSVTSIGDCAFYYCSGLTSVTIPNSVTSIGNSVFYYCTGLTSVTIGNSVTSIGNSAFYHCTNLDTVFMTPSIPPNVGSDVFFNYSSGSTYYAPIIVVYGCSYESYYNSSSWYSYRWWLTEPLYNIDINVASNNEQYGSAEVVLGPTYHAVRCDSTAVVQATANYGYHFDHWSNGSTINPDTLHLIGDSSVTAFFELNIYSVIGTTSQTTRGYVIGSDTVYYLDTVVLTAIANYGYHFQRWNDNNTDNPREIVATGNITKSAVFDYNQYSITLNVDTSIHGSCTGGGSYNYLSNRTIQANANYGYHFTQWNDGVTDNPRYITLTCDTAFTAAFSPNRYTLTLNSNDNTIGSVSGGGEFDYLDTVQISATAVMEHYHFVRWSDGNTDNPRQYVITGDMVLTAIFAIDTHSVVVQSSDIARGMVEASGTEFVYGTPCTVTATAYTGYTFAGWSNGVTASPYTFAVLSDVELTALFIAEGEEVYTITVESADPTMGSVSGGGQAMYGGEVTIRAMANDGYRFVRWNDNDTHSVRIVTVTTNATYTAYFESTTQGIADVTGEEVRVYSIGGRIYVRVDGEAAEEFRVYDLVGREVFHARNADGTSVLPGGIYLVKIGSLPARKVVVIR